MCTLNINYGKGSIGEILAKKIILYHDIVLFVQFCIPDTAETLKVRTDRNSGKGILYNERKQQFKSLFKINSSYFTHCRSVPRAANARPPACLGWRGATVPPVAHLPHLAHQPRGHRQGLLQQGQQQAQADFPTNTQNRFLTIICTVNLYGQKPLPY